MSYSRAQDGAADALALSRIARCLGHTLERIESGEDNLRGEAALPPANEERRVDVILGAGCQPSRLSSAVGHGSIAATSERTVSASIDLPAGNPPAGQADQAGLSVVCSQAGFAVNVSASNPVPALVHLCAWCDFDKVQTRALVAQGKKVSHTICPTHREQQLARARQLNEQRRQAAGGIKEAA